MVASIPSAVAVIRSAAPGLRSSSRTSSSSGLKWAGTYMDGIVADGPRPGSRPPHEHLRSLGGDSGRTARGAHRAHPRRRRRRSLRRRLSGDGTGLALVHAPRHCRTGMLHRPGGRPAGRLDRDPAPSVARDAHHARTPASPGAGSPGWLRVHRRDQRGGGDQWPDDHRVRRPAVRGCRSGARRADPRRADPRA